MVTNMKKRALSAVAVLCSLMILIGIMPTGMLKANAENKITIYFDTSQTPWTGGKCTDETAHGNHGWSKDMSKVWYYAYGSGGKETGLQEMTLTSIPAKDGGQVFKAEIDTDLYYGLIFSSQATWANSDDKLWQTQSLSLSGKANRIFILNGSDFDQSKQGCYDYETYTPTVDYKGRSFNLFNMSSDAITLKIVYANDAGGNNKEYTQTFNGRTQYLNNDSYTTSELIVPENNETDSEPYSKVIIYTAKDNYTTPLHTYVFSEGKILGRTFYYGVTENLTANVSAYGGDGTVLTYQDANFVSRAGGDKQLFLDKTVFPESQTITVGGVDTEAMTSSGNASYKTTSAVSVAKDGVFTVVYNGVKYNLFWSQTSTDNLITIKDNVAVMSGEYTIQSTNNVMPDGQKYITIATDMYDYQYDNFSYYYDVYSPSRGIGNKYGGVKTTEASKNAGAKRPYAAINTALSQSGYGKNTDYPLYLGQFWLPVGSNDDKSGSNYANDSSHAYSSETAKYQRAGHNIGTDLYYTFGMEGDKFKWYSKYFGFGDVLNNFKWSANLAYRTEDQAPGTYEPYDAVVQGLVSNKLSENSDSGVPKDPSGKYNIPYFDKSWWTETVDVNMVASETDKKTVKADMSEYLKTYEGLDFPFFEVRGSDVKFVDEIDKGGKLLSDNSEEYKGTYYLFDSKHYAVRVNTDGTLSKYNNDNNLVYDNYGNGKTTHQEYGFFPFNGPNDGGQNSETLHYGFGVKYTIDFYLTENGTIDGTKDGIPITFTFQGDDDVWVFIDDTLILDMGGAHKNAAGEINFKTKESWVSAAGDASDTSIVSDGKDAKVTSFEKLGLGNLTTGKHKIRMFYMERGMLNSNLYVMFNLPLSLTRLDIQEDTDFSNVNNAFLKATQVVADSDIFNYTVENMGTLNNQVVGSGYKYPTMTDITRTNKDNSINVNTVLSSASSIPQIAQQVIDSDYLYLDISDNSAYSNWYNGQEVYVAYLYNSSEEKGELKNFSKVSADNNTLYRLSYSGNYTKALIFRLPEQGKYYYPDTEFTGNDSTRWNALNSYVDSINGRITAGKEFFYWNRINDPPLSLNLLANNRIVITMSGANSYGSWGTNVTKTVLVDDPNATHSYDFSPALDGSYNPVVSASGGVTYRLTDMFAKTGDTYNTVTYDTRSAFTNTAKDIISLQYGEMATFSKQFANQSIMKVTQLDKLSSPISTTVDNEDGTSTTTVSRVNGYTDSATPRTVNKYYTTYTKSTQLTEAEKAASAPEKSKLYAGIYNGDNVVNTTFEHVNDMYGANKTINATNPNYSSSNIVNLQESSVENGIQTVYSFVDPTNVSNEYLHVRQVVVNEVKTADLSISKELMVDNETTSESFVFTIEFSEIFGSSLGDSQFNISGLKYAVYENGEVVSGKESVAVIGSGNTGTITLNVGQTAKITGIPIGTKYNITEDDSNTSSYEYASGFNIGEDVEIEVGENAAAAYNKRKVGNLNLVKEVYDSETLTNTIDDSTEFTFNVTLTAPTGVDFANYTITKDGTDITPTSGISFEVKVAGNTTVSLEGLPFGTTYTVTESDKQRYTKTAPIYSDADNIINTKATGSVDSVTIKNIAQPIVMPETGGSGGISRTGYIVFGGIMLTLGIGVLLIYRRKQIKAYNK